MINVSYVHTFRARKFDLKFESNAMVDGRKLLSTNYNSNDSDDRKKNVWSSYVSVCAICIIRHENHTYYNTVRDYMVYGGAYCRFNCRNAYIIYIFLCVCSRKMLIRHTRK